MFAGLIAFMISSAAAGLIYYSWQQRDKGWIAAAGWLLAFASALPWSFAVGAEFGISYACIIFICLIWLAVATNMETTGNAGMSVTRPYRNLNWPGLRTCCKHGLLLLLSVPASGFITLMLSVAIVLYLPWSMLHKLTAAMFLFPILWGVLSAWICAQATSLKPTLVCLLSAAVASLLLFI